MHATPAGSRGLDTYLLQYIEANPGSLFHQIVTAARDSLQVSRPTVARHLARLVEDEELSVERGAYRYQETGSMELWLHSESRRFESMVVIDPYGSSWTDEAVEFRVRTGHIRGVHFRAITPGLFTRTWGTAPHTIRWSWRMIPGRTVPEGDFVFDPPLLPRDGRWETIGFSSYFPRQFRMHREAPPTSSMVALGSPPQHEQEGFRFHGAPREPFNDPEPAPFLRLTVVLPLGYPFHGARAYAYDALRGNQPDVPETHRIRTLARASGPSGLRITGSTLTLTVPRPLYSRYYVVRWRLPTQAEYQHWLSKVQSGGGIDLVVPETPLGAPGATRSESPKANSIARSRTGRSQTARPSRKG